MLGTALVVAGSGYVIYLVARRSKSQAGGYRPPVQWEFIHVSKALKMMGTHNGPTAMPHKLVNQKLLDERSRMPPFVVWYRPAELDQSANLPAGQWVSVIDGNHSLKPEGDAQAVFLQTLETKGNADWISRSNLRLWTVAEEVIQNLNRGPLRSEPVLAKAYPSGDPVNLTLPMGAPGAPMPLPPRQPGTTHGSSKEGSGDTDAERA